MFGIDDEYTSNAAGLADLFAPPPTPKSAVQTAALRTRPKRESTSITQNVAAEYPTPTNAPQVDPRSRAGMGQQAVSDIEKYQAEIDKYSGPQDYTAMQNYARERAQGGQKSLLLHLAAQTAGKEYEPIGGAYLKRAMAARDPLKTATGFIDETGQHIEDPQAQAEQRMKFAQAKIARAEQILQSNAAAEEKAEAQRQMIEARKEMLAMTQGLQASIARQASEDRRWAAQLASDDRNAARADKPMPAHIKKELMSNVQSAAAINGALEAVKATPDAFGTATGAANLIPGAVGTVAQTLRDKALTPQQIAARGMVFNNVSKIINERAGAAQSVQEIQRLRGFLPSDTDGPREVQAKLEGFQQFLAEQQAAIRSMHPKAAASPAGRPPAPPAPGAAPNPNVPVQQRARSYYGN